jgi:hypothetical protein
MAQPGYPFNMGDLARRSLKDPTIKAILTAWQAGRYASLEAALTDLSAKLADEKARLQERIAGLLRERHSEGPLTKT